MTNDPTTDALATGEPKPVESDAMPEPAPSAADHHEPNDEGATGAPVEPESVEVPGAIEVVSATKKSRSTKAVEVADSISPADSGAPGAATELVPEGKKKWYAIKVQSGREDTIKAAILRKVAIEGLEEFFGQIMIPFEKVIEKKQVRVKDKKTGEYVYQEKKVERKVKKFQGYLFAELEFNDRILYLIRETSGVGDFLKLRPRANDSPLPEPMTDAEVKQMLGEKAGPGADKKIKIDFEKGDRVRIKEGSFANSEGEVTAISEPKDPTDAPKITVVVTFWGRPLPVELEYWQVTKV